MARIPLLREDDPGTPDAARALLARMKAPRGRLVNLYRALANHPAALEAFTGLGRTVYGAGSLSRKEAELAYTTATVVNQCYY
ncbi:MAG: carboxymuconolactone decarboxylase family protein [Dehalococcoidia bacterium]